jgi:hypothetical protein
MREATGCKIGKSDPTLDSPCVATLRLARSRARPDIQMDPMRTISYWMQRADFSATEHLPIDTGRAIELLRAHDWLGEWDTSPGLRLRVLSPAARVWASLVRDDRRCRTFAAETQPVVHQRFAG